MTTPAHTPPFLSVPSFSFTTTFLVFILVLAHLPPSSCTPLNSSPRLLCQKCCTSSDGSDRAECLAGVHTCEASADSDEDSEMAMTKLSEDERKKLCLRVQEIGSSEDGAASMYCEGLKMVRARGLMNRACDLTYVYLNGVEVLFLRALYEQGIDVIHSLESVSELRPVQYDTERTAETSRVALTKGEKQTKSESAHTRPAVSEMIFKDEVQFYKAAVRETFEKMRSEKGNENLKMTVEVKADGRVYVRFHFEKHHIVEF